MFNFIKYLKDLHQHNKLVQQHKLVFTTCSGESMMQGAIANYRKAHGYIVANDVCTGGSRKINGMWYQRRQFSFFILKKCDMDDEQSCADAMDFCREVRRQFISKFLQDMQEKNFAMDGILDEMNKCGVNFDMDDIRSSEFPDMQLNNCTGLYVLVNLDEPLNLGYESNLWTER